MTEDSPDIRDTGAARSPDVPAGFDDSDLISLVAASLLAYQHEAISASGYPQRIQRATNLLSLRCLSKGVDGPKSVPDLVVWSREKSLDQWPLALGGLLEDSSAFLIDSRTAEPTEVCHELARHLRGRWEVDLIEEAAILPAMQFCRERDSPESYVAFRRLLIERPVLLSTDLDALAIDPELDFLRRHIEVSCYSPVPASFEDDGQVQLCDRCGNLMQRASSGRMICTLERCSSFFSPRIGVAVDYSDRPYSVTAAVRKFVTGPGLAEVALQKRLQKRGVETQLWPQFDAFDLLVTLPNGARWAVDVKDWAVPDLLAANTTPIPEVPPHDSAFIVVPDERFKQSPRYKTRWRRRVTPEVARGMSLMSVTEFIAKVDKELGR